jgi:hypothetical protein
MRIKFISEVANYFFFLKPLSLLFCIMMLSIIIPTYNEAKIIRKTIEFLQGNLVGKKMLKLLFRWW